MSAFPETKKGFAKLAWRLRALLCEEAIAFAYWVCPKGYCPSPSSALADEIRKPGSTMDAYTARKAAIKA